MFADLSIFTNFRTGSRRTSSKQGIRSPTRGTSSTSASPRSACSGAQTSSIATRTWKLSSTPVSHFSLANPDRSEMLARSSLRLSVLLGTDEFSVPAPLADTLRQMLHPNPKERSSAGQIITSLSTMDLTARGIPRLSLKGEFTVQRRLCSLSAQRANARSLLIVLLQMCRVGQSPRRQNLRGRHSRARSTRSSSDMATRTCSSLSHRGIGQTSKKSSFWSVQVQSDPQ